MYSIPVTSARYSTEYLLSTIRSTTRLLLYHIYKYAMIGSKLVQYYIGDIGYPVYTHLKNLAHMITWESGNIDTMMLMAFFSEVS